MARSPLAHHDYLTQRKSGGGVTEGRLEALANAGAVAAGVEAGLFGGEQRAHQTYDDHGRHLSWAGASLLGRSNPPNEGRYPAVTASHRAIRRPRLLNLPTVLLTHRLTYAPCR